MKSIIVETFWTGTTGKALAQFPGAQRLALYLLTGPASNVIGLYRLDIKVAAKHLGMITAMVKEEMLVLEKLGFARFFDGWVWVLEMARYQLGPKMKCSDNRVKHVQALVDAAADSPFVTEFTAKYGPTHCVKPPRGTTVDPAPVVEPKPEPKAKKPPTPAAEAKVRTRAEEIRAVVAHYKKYFPERFRKFDSGSPEWNKINARFEDKFTFEELCASIDGMMRSPFHQGDNDDGRKYDSLEICVRSRAKVEQFIAMPKAGEKPVLNKKNRRGQDAAQSLLAMEFGDLTEDEANSLEVK